ncbi:hypothetical protein LIER_34046 [Lithospermum erythrorhizon]|uniref:Reverse transcriptase RNase H-like domain-containing protein n=1 Tax=Lithospermum erythrorhizon TaxID=34254 RepID=A0AAV3S0A1_LITER
MKIYVDDIFVKSRRGEDHLANYRETLEVLRSSRLLINPEKCSFGVTSGKFLGFMISKRGIERNLDKIEAILNMEPPTSYKEVQRLTGVEGILGIPKLLTRPEEVEELQLYLAISEGAVSSVLVREEQGIQRPIYYASHVQNGVEESYLLIDKFVLTVVIVAWKLKAYFEAYPIRVMTDQPIKRIMSNPSMTGRLTTWAIELSEFEVSYVPRTSVKAQALADFIVECTTRIPEEVQGPREGKLEEVLVGNYTWMEPTTKKGPELGF